MHDKSLVFISHRHEDQAIAEAVARFLYKGTAGTVRVHLSSSPEFEGPRHGKPLNDELRRSLAGAEAVILVFTSAAEDWSYCMWECGVATDPKDDTPTAVVVLQCGTDEPKPYGDRLRVNVRDLRAVQGFVKALLTTTDFFPHREIPLTGFSPDGPQVREAAAELHAALGDVLPVDWRKETRRPTCPYLRLRVPDDAANQLRSSYPTLTASCRETVAAMAEIVEHADAQGLLGMVLRSGTTLGEVLVDWQQEHDDGAEPRWFDALAEQIQAALAGRLRPVKWAPYCVETGRSDVPFVSSWRTVASGVELDVYLVPFSPRPVPVQDRMIPRDQMYLKDLAYEAPDGVRLVDVVDEMGARKVSRLPILHDRSPRAIVHLSTINAFLVAAWKRDRRCDPTLEDLLVGCGNPGRSFVEVESAATIEEATKAMAANEGCQDVYVTRDGKVVGWLPNVLLIPE